MISLVDYELSGLRSSMVILQVHHSTPATGLPMGKVAGLPSLPEPQAHFSGHPSLVTSYSTQCRPPSRACRAHRDALKTAAFPLQFHPAGPYYTMGEVTTTNISAALHRHSTGWLGVPHICTDGLRVYPLSEKCR